MVVGSFEAKTKLAALLQAVLGGQEVTITLRRVPVARLVPINNNKDENGHAEEEGQASARAGAQVALG